MVKFTKQFEGQLVPEWKEAFVDYWQLKKDIKKIHIESTSHKPKPKEKNSLKNKLFSSIQKLSLFGNQHRDNELIHVHSKLASTTSNRVLLYETELLEQFDGTEAASEFFALLDHQLNKVNEFYRKKEKEFLDRGECLEKQLHILFELKTALKDQHKNKANSSHHDCKDEDTSISGTISCDEESNRGIIDQDLQEVENGDLENDCNQFDDSPRSKKEEQNQSGSISYSHGKKMKIRIPLTNPTRTFSYLLWEDLINQSSKKQNSNGKKLHINKTKLHHAEKMIRGALIELYKGLGYLKTYRNLNMLAFAKILKKFDKVTSKKVLPIYLKVVESSYFNSSDKIIKLADEVEEIFVKKFAQDDRRKAMKYLKPAQRKESHSVTFFIGLYTGCFIALFVGYAIMAHITGTYRPQTNTIYMETVYPLLSMFSLLFLHFFLYGCNIFMWKKTRINYSFIFDQSARRELKYRDVFLICTMSMTVVVGVLFIHLSLMEKGYSYSQVDCIPGFLLLVFLVLLVCPFNIVYKSSRYRLLSVLRNIVLSPLYKVVMLDFFMADQLCSQVPMLRNLEYVGCYYITGSYKTQDYGYCVRTKNYRDLAYAVSFLPYYWRAMQCARRWLDEGDTGHLINLGKYVSAMLAAGAKVAYEKDKSVGWLCLVVIMSSIATVYQLYWDFVKDWGLLQMNSKNPWLRNELILRRKFIYFLSMGLNLILRLAWLQTVLHYKFGSIDYRLTGLFLAALEVIRRGQWNFYRLENEHLNNAGKFRAVKTVPLPFEEVDEQD
ncbi:phosphate transporter PHO1 homolog 1-like [Rutidosis leptorrhynchoides]|uniref:phosphate transporter PHO1 homolog 1-like n=1 Tax=Rutidosis leptorrhynchoides TaxID=125765 RepID=UPI003A992E89